MQSLPPGTMIVFAQWLYLGLLGCAVLGFSIGLLAAFWFFDRRCTTCVAEDIRNGYLSEDEVA